MDALIREPAVAGQFYEADPVRLKEFVESSINRHADRAKNNLRAVIVPHAGYVYSGEVAAETFARAAGNHFSRVVVIAPSHRVGFRGVATSDYTVYKTPIGDLQIDEEAVESLNGSGSKYIGRLTEAHTAEHALEVELPFIVEMFPDSKIVPLVCGEIDGEIAKEVADKLVSLFNEDTLWVISSDFTHYGDAFGYRPFKESVEENLKTLDLGAVDEILKLNGDTFRDYIHNTGATICGNRPISILLETINKSGVEVNAELVDYTTSGKLTGDFKHSVSYVGMSFTEQI